MDKQSAYSDQTVRAFIALDIAEPMRDELARLQTELRQRLDGDINWVNPHNIHLTLRFLGNIPPALTEQVKVILQNVAHNNRRFSIELGVLSAFPHAHNPRVIWAGVTSGLNELNQLSGYLDEQLNRAGFASDERPFHPHLTLARVKNLTDRRRFSQCLDEITPQPVNTPIDRICLFKSVLQGNGPIYTVLAEYPIT